MFDMRLVLTFCMTESTVSSYYMPPLASNVQETQFPVLLDLLSYSPMCQRVRLLSKFHDSPSLAFVNASV